MDVNVHRFKAIVHAQAVDPPLERGILVPGENRRTVPLERFEVAAVLPVVRRVPPATRRRRGPPRAIARRRSPRAPWRLHTPRTRFRRRAFRRRAADQDVPRHPAPSGIRRKPGRASRGQEIRFRAGHSLQIPRGGAGNTGRKPLPSRSFATGKLEIHFHRAGATSHGPFARGIPPGVVPQRADTSDE